MKLEKIVESMKDDIIKAAQELVRIRSIEGNPEPGAPFGKEVRICLDRSLDICSKLGFKTENFDGFAGHAEYGEGDEIVGILVHVDIVPEGSGWSQNPYGGDVVNDKIYGRGTIDDKGPAAAAIYALKAVADSGVKFNRRVRIIIGCDEESGRWGCMKHYFKYAEAPMCGFSPDADFPIINSEMGILIFNLEKEFEPNEDSRCGGLRIKRIQGGNRVNMVPDYCECELEMKKDFTDRVIKTVEYMKNEQNMKLEMEIRDDKCIINSYGISAHGATPGKGVNAISQLISCICKLPLCVSEQTEYVNFLNSSIGMEIDGKSFGVAMNDEVSGNLVFNLGTIDMSDKKGSVGINIRYPVTKTGKEVYDIIRRKSSEAGIKVIEGNGQDPLYVPADNFMIKILQKVYENVTGQKADLISIGGGTYARAIKNAVAFGPLFPGKEETAHQKDEYIEVDDLMKCTKMFAEAIYELVK
ncbi:MAG TPA: dipeptidase PepV [Bacillota bacterium]|nr:dipeptidase PepV [Bacillota bacterium]HNT02325.1 dipeptidase PepV [Bacillota bacterium]HPA54249.1 dipeptidase PepV [Bacillota bacterium]HPX68128.1 dipeptidase PepV [Bacillota bacterium]HQA64504.1 dipeptidase PepV [Bacillota bacterium]